MQYPNTEVYNTICNATANRQGAALELAKRSDIFIVIGSDLSANTKRLYDIASRFCQDTYWINSEGQFDSDWINKKRGTIKIIGLTAGASTPGTTINNITNRLKEIIGKDVSIELPEQVESAYGLVLDSEK